MPPEEFGNVLRLLDETVSRSVLMAFEGRSKIRGRNPKWFNAATDIRFVGVSGQDETILHFEAPQFGEAAEEVYAQTQLFPFDRPPEDYTGFDLLGGVLEDVQKHNADSDRFDRALLRELRNYRRVFNGTFTQFSLDRLAIDLPAPPTLNELTIRTAEELTDETPRPRRIRIAGKLDMVRMSTQSFALKLDEGEEVRGVLSSGDMSDIKELLNTRVLVHGEAVYRPSGKLLRLEANTIESGEHTPSLWSRVPAPLATSSAAKSTLRQIQTPRKSVEAFFGTWDGDETDEELLDALAKVRE